MVHNTKHPIVKSKQEIKELFKELLPLIEHGTKVTINDAKKNYMPKLWNLIFPQMFFLRSDYNSIKKNSQIKIDGNDLTEKEADELSIEIYKLLTRRKIKNPKIGKIKTLRFEDTSTSLFTEHSPKIEAIRRIKESLMHNRVLTIVGLWGGLKIISLKYKRMFNIPFPNLPSISIFDLADSIALENLWIRFHEIEKLGIKIQPVLVVSNGFSALSYPNLSRESDPDPMVLLRLHERYLKTVRETASGEYGFDVIHVHDLLNVLALVMMSEDINAKIKNVSVRSVSWIVNDKYKKYLKYLTKLSSEHVYISPFQKSSRYYNYKHLKEINNKIIDYDFSFLKDKSINEIIRIFAMSDDGISEEEKNILNMFLSSIGVTNINNLFLSLGYKIDSPMKLLTAISLISYDMFISEMLFSLLPYSVQWTYLEPKYMRMVYQPLPYLYLSPFGRGINNRPWFTNEKILAELKRFPEIELLK
ncbi:hypothetical protein J7J90_03070 [Candidatus Micrarchaeota archaeon]|nr:hypothetical protein [Candidatus Micrarchaeota archaeon]